MYTVQSNFFPPQSWGFPVWDRTAYSQLQFLFFLCWTFGHRRTRLRSTNSTSYRLTWGVFDLCINLRLLHTTCELILTCMRRSTACCFRLYFVCFVFWVTVTEGGVKLHADQKLHDSFVFFLRNCLCVLKGTGNRPPPLWCLTTWHTSRQPHYVPLYLCNLSYYGNLQLFFHPLQKTLKLNVGSGLWLD